MLPRKCALFLIAFLALCGDASADTFDIILRNGTVIDGTGKPAFRADVGIKEGRIAAVGNFPASACDIVDASNFTVAPGFIDVHTHAESEVKSAVGGDDILSIPEAENFVRMGVTSIVTGNCGLSSPDIRAFLNDVDRIRPAVNVATLVGHNTLREMVMGGLLRRPPTEAELLRMGALVEEAMEAGALGLSTGLIYVPGSFAKTEELVALARIAAKSGGIYATHMRYETAQILDAIEEVLRIAREARIPVQISHLKLSGPAAWGKSVEVLSKLDAARSEGLRVTHDCYAYTFSSTGLAQLLPDAAREGGREAFRRRVADPVQREAIVAEMAAMRRRLGRQDYAYATVANYEAEPALQGKTIVEAAQHRYGTDTLEAQVQLLLEIESKGGGSGVFQNMSTPDMHAFLSHPMTMIASDGSPRRFGGEMPHPRSFGNNTRVLGRFVRREKWFPLEEAVRKMTSLPADTFRLENRGRIQVGAEADVVVFDASSVVDRSEVGDPHHWSEGFQSVLVGGTFVLRDGKMTGIQPGKALRLSH